ncbi:MAG TPA: fumarylacetoacetate hydrolase family protein [Ilumatobacteraceae bacterium]|nr:fumarylacetoacetate hydrolase family protein [Ilumatobacteraceae bacterium]
MTSRPNTAQIAAIVDEAALSGTAIAQFTAQFEFNVDEAYAVQTQSIDRRLARGERLVGVKMGLTSRAKMAQVGVDQVIWGRLTDAMIVTEGAPLSIGRFVHPRVEPEVAFLIGASLAGNVTIAEAMSAVEGVAPAAEIIDSRYQNFQFALADVIADNSSSSGFVVGPWASPEVDISNLAMVLSVDGRPAQIGSSAAILGNPLRSLVEAARAAASAGLTLEPGWIVLAGGATAAEPLAVGSTYRVDVESLGSVAFSVTA